MCCRTARGSCCRCPPTPDTCSLSMTRRNILRNFGSRSTQCRRNPLGTRRSPRTNSSRGLQASHCTPTRTWPHGTGLPTSGTVLLPLRIGKSPFRIAPIGHRLFGCMCCMNIGRQPIQHRHRQGIRSIRRMSIPRRPHGTGTFETWGSRSTGRMPPPDDHPHTSQGWATQRCRPSYSHQSSNTSRGSCTAHEE